MSYTLYLKVVQGSRLELKKIQNLALVSKAISFLTVDDRGRGRDGEFDFSDVSFEMSTEKSSGVSLPGTAGKLS